MQTFENAGGCKALAMVYPVSQTLGNVFQPMQAIRYGTLFPELNKPMKGECAHEGCAQPTECQAKAFAAWEMRLYLDTHPDCQRGLMFYRQLCEQACCPNYACTFAPQNGGRSWNWVDDPWPWELAANERRG